MKVLWVEDHEPVRDMLAIAADKAARNRVQVDLVTASTLMEAEARVRLERFDLVVLDLTLPDSIDGDMTIARMANMGKYRIGVCLRKRRARRSGSKCASVWVQYRARGD